MARPEYHAWTHSAFGSDPLPAETGWTAVFGDGLEPVVVGADQAVWLVPRPIVGGRKQGWFVFAPDAGVFTPSSSGDIEIQINAVLVDETSVIAVVPLLDDPIVIEEGEYTSYTAAAQPVPGIGLALWNNDDDPIYTFLSIEVVSAGTGATGLSVNVPVGSERVAGSGVH